MRRWSGIAQRFVVVVLATLFIAACSDDGGDDAEKVKAVRSRAEVEFLDDDQIVSAGEAACDNPDLALDDARGRVIDELGITVNEDTTTVLLDVFCDEEPN